MVKGRTLSPAHQDVSYLDPLLERTGEYPSRNSMNSMPMAVFGGGWTGITFPQSNDFFQRSKMGVFHKPFGHMKKWGTLKKPKKN